MDIQTVERQLKKIPSVKEVNITPPPSDYEAFIYKWTNQNTGRKYLGSHKGEIGDILENYPKDFINVCKEINGRWWIPAIYNTEKYMIAPKIVEDKLTWVIRDQSILNAEDVSMPTFYDAYVVIQLMETRSGEVQTP